METPPAAVYLESRGIQHRVFRHAGPLRSLEQAAQERAQEPAQVVRSIVFRIAAADYVMVLAAGPGQISWPALRSYLGQRRVTMASEAEVLQATGSPLGAVSPFGLPAPMRILLDKSVLAQTEISLGSGVRAVALMMQTADLQAALGDVEVVDLL